MCMSQPWMNVGNIDVDRQKEPPIKMGDKSLEGMRLVEVGPSPTQHASNTRMTKSSR